MSQFCPNCGKEISDRVKFCPTCGADIRSYELKSADSPNIVKPITVVGKSERDFSFEIFICVFVSILGLIILLVLNIIPVERILNQDISITQMASICNSGRGLQVIGYFSNRSCEFYSSVNGFGILFGYLFLITGFISSFVVLWQHRKLFF